MRMREKNIREIMEKQTLLSPARVLHGTRRCPRCNSKKPVTKYGGRMLACLACMIYWEHAYKTTKQQYEDFNTRRRLA